MEAYLSPALDSGLQVTQTEAPSVLYSQSLTDSVHSTAVVHSTPRSDCLRADRLLLSQAPDSKRLYPAQFLLSQSCCLPCPISWAWSSRHELKQMQEACELYRAVRIAFLPIV